MAGGGGRNRSLKTDYDPYSKDERESYQSSLKDIPGMSEWLEDKVGDWSNIKDDAGLGDRLTRKDFQDLIGGEDAENLFNFQSSRQGGNRNMFMPGMGIMGQGGRGIGALAGLGIGGGGRGLGGLALAQLMGGGAGMRSDGDYMDQWTEGDMGYMDEQTINDITRREGFSDVAPWQQVENSGWGGEEWIRNPYSTQNQDYYEEHGGRGQAVEALGPESHWAHEAVSQRGPGEELENYWAWTPPEQSGGQPDQLAEMTQAAQGQHREDDEDQD